MTTKSITTFGSADLITRAQAGDASARAELVRRHEKRIANGKKPLAKVARFLGLAEAPEAPKAKAASPAPAPAPEANSGERLFASLSGLERHRALKRMAASLGLATDGGSNTLEIRIMAAKASGAPAPEPTPAPTGDDIDAKAIVEGVQRLADEWLAQRAEIARLKAQAAKPAASGGDWLKSVASALKSTGHLSA